MAVELYENDDDKTFTVVLNGSDHILTAVTASGDDVDSWIDSIYRIHRRRLHNLLVGLDVEWRPSYGRFQNPVAVLQICVGRRCLVFQILHADYVPDSLVRFLTDGRFTFLGVGVDADVEKLAEDYELEVGNTVDLRHLAAEKLGIRDMRQAGIKRLAAAVMGIEINKPKSVTMSRWDSGVLNWNQVQYACVDAFLSFEIGRRLYAGDF